ncbi:MAG: bestrophin family protein [Pirellulales bacterium]
MIPYERGAWIRLLFATHGSLARAVLGRVLTFGGLALAVCAVDQFTHHSIRLPVGFHEIAGVIIGLILAFRTNTAYARFWEGRTLWGGIVNASRGLAMTVTNHAGLDEAESREFRSWIVAFAFATRCRLRGLPEVTDAASVLAPDDYQRLKVAPHPAVFCANELSRRIADLVERQALNPMLATVAEGRLATLIDCLGGCERILKTPTPLGYILLMERGVFLYLVTLPAGLVGRLGWLTPVVTVGVAYLVLMIEAIGNELDNPFGTEPSDIPLDHICGNLAFELLGVGPRPEVGAPKGVGDIEM